MKCSNLWILWIVASLFGGCVSASKSLQKGRYDEAIEKSITVLHKKPSDEEHLEILKISYRLADLNDEERIVELKKSGEPDVWAQVVSIYERMINRNKQVDVLPPSVKNTIAFSYQTYSEELATAKKKAADYYYALGVQNLEKGSRSDARLAFENFERVASYAGTSYKDVENLKNEARNLGITRVLYRVENQTGRMLPNPAMYHLENINLDRLSSFWLKYEHAEESSKEIDNHYIATFSMDYYFLSPVALKTQQKTYSKTITEGTEYLSDSRGKPVLDSNGNFIKIPKKVTIRCNVVEVIQQKEASLRGNLSYYDVANNRRMRVFPLIQSIVIENSVFDVKGDLRALNDQVRKRIKTPSVPLPPDEELLVLTTQEMSEKIRQAMRNYSWALK